MSVSAQQDHPSAAAAARRRPLLVRLPLAIGYWLWWFFVYAAVVIVCGALIGALLFATVGMLTHPHLHVLRRVEIGLADGFLYSGMWSGGVAIVFCVMRAHRINEQRRRIAAFLSHEEQIDAGVARAEALGAEAIGETVTGEAATGNAATGETVAGKPPAAGSNQPQSDRPQSGQDK